MSASAPVVALTVLGVVVTILGMFAGAAIEYVIVGLAAIAVAGLINAASPRPA